MANIKIPIVEKVITIMAIFIILPNSIDFFEFTLMNKYFNSLEYY